ncbi:MAG: hypothetical protein ACOC4M_00165 [Promethearchaeia archaeon]
MSEKKNLKEREKEKEINESEIDDYQNYIKEMTELGSDFSDLDNLDLEEIEEMKEAVQKVQEGEIPDQSAPEELKEPEINQIIDEKEELFEDFSDLEAIDFDELREMKEAIEEVKEEDSSQIPEGSQQAEKASESVSESIEKRIKEELEKKRKEEEEEDVMTPERFLEYLKEKKDKIWYHALYFLAFEVNDHIASKELLYKTLKEVTSKSAIDPIPEHQFFFGLAYILRLTLNEKKIIRYLPGSKFKININIETIQDLLKQAGEPIRRRPVIPEGKKKKMFKNFLDDDFSDI